MFAYTYTYHTAASHRKITHRSQIWGIRNNEEEERNRGGNRREREGEREVEGETEGETETETETERGREGERERETLRRRRSPSLSRLSWRPVRAATAVRGVAEGLRIAHVGGSTILAQTALAKSGLCVLVSEFIKYT